MKLRIFKPAPSPIQSGIKKPVWCCIFLEEQHMHNSKLSNKIFRNSDKYRVLKFNSQESAMNYAKKLGCEFELVTPVENRIEKKTYIP